MLKSRLYRTFAIFAVPVGPCGRALNGVCTWLALAVGPVLMAASPQPDNADEPLYPSARWTAADLSEQEIGGDYASFRPANAAEISAELLAMRGELGFNKVAPAPDRALLLDEALHKDWGDPNANRHWQESLLIGVQAIKFTDAETRSAFHDVVLDYVESGGGRMCATGLSHTASALLHVSRPGDAYTVETAERLYDEAAAWAGSAKQDSMLVLVNGERRRHMAAFEVRADQNVPGEGALVGLLVPTDAAAVAAPSCDVLKRAIEKLRRAQKAPLPQLQQITPLLEQLALAPPGAGRPARCEELQLRSLLRQHARLLGAGRKDADGAWIAEIDQQLRHMLNSGIITKSQSAARAWANAFRRHPGEASPELVELLAQHTQHAESDSIKKILRPLQSH